VCYMKKSLEELNTITSKFCVFNYLSISNERSRNFLLSLVFHFEMGFCMCCATFYTLIAIRKSSLLPSLVMMQIADKFVASV